MSSSDAIESPCGSLAISNLAAPACWKASYTYWNLAR